MREDWHKFQRGKRSIYESPSFEETEIALRTRLKIYSLCRIKRFSEFSRVANSSTPNPKSHSASDLRRGTGRGLFRRGVVRLSHWKPREPRKPRDDILKTTLFLYYKSPFFFSRSHENHGKHENNKVKILETAPAQNNAVSVLRLRSRRTLGHWQNTRISPKSLWDEVQITDQSRATCDLNLCANRH